MPFLLFFLLTLTCLQSHWPERPGWLGPLGSALLTWAGILSLGLAAWWLTRTHRQRMLQEPDRRPYWLRRFATWRRRHFLALLGFYLYALFFLGWGHTIQEWWANSYLPGQELLLLTPMLTGLFATWFAIYDVERTAHEIALYPESNPFLSRRAYVVLQARHNLLLVVPPLFLLLVQQILFGFFPGLKQAGPWVPLVGIGLLATAFVSIPLVLRWFLGLSPLPAGPIRDRLEATARRLGFRYADILVWNTRHSVANAMVTGGVPWVRYVVVTDRLLDELTADEIEGVFGHEVGHIKHHHMSFYILFMFSSLISLWGLVYLAAALLRQPWVQTLLQEDVPLLFNLLLELRLYALVPLLFLFGGYLFVVFGYLSRRCERQADIYGCRTSSTQAFIDALEKVAQLNGIPRDKPGWLSCWQHGTIGQRIAFLQAMSQDAALEPRFQFRLWFLKWGVLLGLVLLTTGVLFTMQQLLPPGEIWQFFQHL